MLYYYNVMFAYYLIKDKVYASALSYTKFKKSDEDYLSELACEFFAYGFNRSKPKKKHHFIYGDFSWVESRRISKEIQSTNKIYLANADSHDYQLFDPIIEFSLNNKGKRLAKMVLNRHKKEKVINIDKDLLHLVYSSDDEEIANSGQDLDKEINHKINATPNLGAKMTIDHPKINDHDVISKTLNKKIDVICDNRSPETTLSTEHFDPSEYNQVVVKDEKDTLLISPCVVPIKDDNTQKINEEMIVDISSSSLDDQTTQLSEPLIRLDEERRNNIELLLSINYITKHNFIIMGDKVLLKKPCGNAVGDYITNRSDFYISKDPRFGLSCRSDRICNLDL